MATTNMLTYSLYLEQQPGGVMPELHLKKGCSAVKVILTVKVGSTLTNTQRKRCVVKGTLPDGGELFFTEYIPATRGDAVIEIESSDVKKMAAAEGSFKCTLTILDTNASVNRKTYMNYEFLTVLPFKVVVHGTAY